MYQVGCQWTDFRKICCWMFLLTSVEKFDVRLISDKNIGHFMWSTKYVPLLPVMWVPHNTSVVQPTIQSNYHKRFVLTIRLKVKAHLHGHTFHNVSQHKGNGVPFMMSPSSQLAWTGRYRDTCRALSHGDEVTVSLSSFQRHRLATKWLRPVSQHVNSTLTSYCVVSGSNPGSQTPYTNKVKLL